jgi:parallel beta-helix repeat protein
MTNDTTKLQILLNAGKQIPKGTYYIDAMVGIEPKGGLLNLEGVELRAIPQSNRAYAIVLVKDVNDLTIKGGRIIGERHQHIGGSRADGGYGYGIRVMGNSARVTIDGVYIADCYGDGILISGGVKDVVDSPTVKNCTLYRNRRQGISVGSCKNLKITNNRITFTEGTPPECGIDVEPWDNEVVQGVTITGNTITDNAGSAVVLSAARGKILAPIRVTGNAMARNRNRLPCCRVNKLPRGDNWLTDLQAVFGIYRREYVA